MTKDEALHLALEALEDLGMKHYENTGEVLYKETFTAIKAALEAKDEPCCYGGIAHDCHAGKGCQIAERLKTSAKVKGEPVAWYRNEDGIRIYYESKVWDDVIPLYTTPPQRTWVGLTDEEIKEGCKESWVTLQAWQSAVWWAEAKLKEKNNG